MPASPIWWYYPSFAAGLEPGCALANDFCRLRCRAERELDGEFWVVQRTHILRHEQLNYWTRLSLFRRFLRRYDSYVPDVQRIGAKLPARVAVAGPDYASSLAKYPAQIQAFYDQRRTLREKWWRLALDHQFGIDRLMLGRHPGRFNRPPTPAEAEYARRGALTRRLFAAVRGAAGLGDADLLARLVALDLFLSDHFDARFADPAVFALWLLNEANGPPVQLLPPRSPVPRH